MPDTEFTPGNIYIAVSEQELAEIALSEVWRREMIQDAKSLNLSIKNLETAKSVLTNPDHETGNTAYIGEEIRQALIHLAAMASSALDEVAKGGEAA